MNEELKVIISAEIDKLKKGVQTAQKQISSFKSNVSKYSKNIDADFKAIGNAITSGLKVAGAAVVGAGAGLLALTGTTEEYRKEQDKLKTAFENAGGSADTAKTVYNNLYRVLGDSAAATEASQQLARITTEEAKLTEYTTALQGAYAVFGDSLPTNSLAEAANETIKVGTATGAFSDAINWTTMTSEQMAAAFEGHPKALKKFETAIKNGATAEDAFNEAMTRCRTEGEREQVVRQMLNALYGDAAASYETNAAALLAQNEAQAKLTENMATLGGALQPVLTALTSLAADCLAVITPYITSFVDNYLPSIVSLLGEVSGALETALQWMTEHSTILSAIAIVIGTVVAAIGLYNAVAAVKAAMDAAQVATLGGLIAAQLAHAAAAIAAIAPYILIVAAIAAVIAIIVLCVKHWDKIKEVVVKVAKAVWEKVQEMATKVGEFFSNMGEAISTAVSNAKEAAVNKFNEIKNKVKEKAGEAYETAKEKFGNLKDSVSNSIELAKSAVSTKFANIYSTISTKVSNAFSTVQEKFGNIKQSIQDAIEDARSFVSEKIAAIKDLLGLKGFSWSLPKPSFPKFSVSGGEAPWGFMGQGSLPKIKISWNALGGVFDKPTVFGYGGSLQGIGEAGAEAVVPLEKNTQWLDRIAERLAAKQGNTPIVLTVDGKVFAQTSIDSINQLTRQTGHLSLNIL